MILAFQLFGWLSYKIQPKTLVFAILALMTIEGSANLRTQWNIMGEFSNLPQEELLEWIKVNTRQGKLFNNVGCPHLLCSQTTKSITNDCRGVATICGSGMSICPHKSYVQWKEAPKAGFLRLQATDLEILTTGGVLSTKASLPSPIEIGFYLNDLGPVSGSVVAILQKENWKCLCVLLLQPSFS